MMPRNNHFLQANTTSAMTFSHKLLAFKLPQSPMLKPVKTSMICRRNMKCIRERKRHVIISQHGTGSFVPTSSEVFLEPIRIWRAPSNQYLMQSRTWFALGKSCIFTMTTITQTFHDTWILGINRYMYFLKLHDNYKLVPESHIQTRALYISRWLRQCFFME